MCGYPPEMLSCPDLPLGPSAVRDHVKWEASCNRIWDDFAAWWNQEPGCKRIGEIESMRHDLGLNGGYPGICGFDIPVPELVTPNERLHAKNEGEGEHLVRDCENVEWTAGQLSLMTALLRRFRAPVNMSLPREALKKRSRGFFAPYMSGEGHRLLHELLPIVLEAVRLALPADWSVTAQLVLDAAAKYARWCRDASKAVIEYPASCKAMVKSSSEYTRARTKAKLAVGNIEDDDDDLDGVQSDDASDRCSKRRRTTPASKEAGRAGHDHGFAADDYVEYFDPTDSVTYHGKVLRVTPTSVTSVMHSDGLELDLTQTQLKWLSRVSVKRPVRDVSVLVRFKRQYRKLSDDDYRMMSAGIKRGSARTDGLTARNHGPEHYTDTGLSEKENKALHAMYQNSTNHQMDGLAQQMARAISQREPVIMMDRETATEPKPAANSFVVPEPRLTGGVVLAATTISAPSPGEMQLYRSGAADHKSKAVIVRLEPTVAWGGTLCPGDTAAKRGLRSASGTYHKTDPPGEHAVSVRSRWLANTASPEWTMREPDVHSLAGLELWWAAPGSDDVPRLLGVVTSKKGGGDGTMSFKVSRSFLAQNGMIDCSEDQLRGTAAAKVRIGTHYVGAPKLPCSAAPDGMPSELALLVSELHGPGGDHRGKSDVVIHRSARTPGGRVDADYNWRGKGQQRLTVATRSNGQHVLVRSLFRTRPTPPDAGGGGGGEWKDLALVRPLVQFLPALHSSSPGDLGAVWTDLGLVLLRHGAGPDTLIPVKELSAMPHYCTPVDAGPVAAVIAPWVGRRSRFGTT